jgi:hypothetical protein
MPMERWTRKLIVNKSFKSNNPYLFTFPIPTTSHHLSCRLVRLKVFLLKLSCTELGGHVVTCQVSAPPAGARSQLGRRFQSLPWTMLFDLHT